MPRIVELARAFPGSDVGTLTYPHSPDVASVVRQIPGRTFNTPAGRWLIPLTAANVLLLRDGLKELGWLVHMPRELADDLNREWHQTKQAGRIRDAGDADIAFDFHTEPYAHQRAGLAFLSHLGGGALFWEMGLGKTKTAIDFGELLDHVAGDAPVEQRRRCRDCWHSGLDHASGRCAGLPTCQCRAINARPLRVLVICPNTIKRNWAAEIERHAGHVDYVIPTGVVAKRIGQLASARYTIVNCELLSVEAAAKALKAIEWDLIVVDESTRFKTPAAARTKALMKLRAKHRVILTGTPITGHAIDAYAQLEFVKPGTFGKSFWTFKDRYIKTDFWGKPVGIKPDRHAELKSRIDTVSYRILKADVLDLPPKIGIDPPLNRVVEMRGEQRRAYNQMRDELRIELANNTEIRANNVLTMLLRLTQVTAGFVGAAGDYHWLEANAKVAELDGILDELGDEPAVIFGQYHFELEQLARRYVGDEQPPGLPIIYGPTPEGRRQELIEEFQAGQRRLLFCQTRTGGIGINLFAARTIVFYTRSWSLEEYLQAQDRPHRIGLTHPVTYIHLLADDSIDSEIAASLTAKKELADDLTGDAARKLAARILGGNL